MIAKPARSPCPTCNKEQQHTKGLPDCEQCRGEGIVYSHTLPGREYPPERIPPPPPVDDDPGWTTSTKEYRRKRGTPHKAPLPPPESPGWSEPSKDYWGSRSEGSLNLILRFIDWLNALFGFEKPKHKHKHSDEQIDDPLDIVGEWVNTRFGLKGGGFNFVSTHYVKSFSRRKQAYCVESAGVTHWMATEMFITSGYSIRGKGKNKSYPEQMATLAELFEDVEKPNIDTDNDFYPSYSDEVNNPESLGKLIGIIDREKNRSIPQPPERPGWSEVKR